MGFGFFCNWNFNWLEKSYFEICDISYVLLASQQSSSSSPSAVNKASSLTISIGSISHEYSACSPGLSSNFSYFIDFPKSRTGLSTRPMLSTWGIGSAFGVWTELLSDLKNNFWIHYFCLDNQLIDKIYATSNFPISYVEQVVVYRDFGQLTKV